MDRKNLAIRLFIADSAEVTESMNAGGVYALIAETPPARFPLLASSLAGAVEKNVPVTLLMASSPKPFIDRLKQVGFAGAEDALDAGRFSVYQFQDNFNKNIFRFGTQAFLNELDNFHIPAASYMVVDQADELLSLHDITLALRQAEALASWAKKIKVTVLLVFTRVAAVASSLATLTGLMDHLSGVASLGGQQDGLSLTFGYWQSPEGTVAAKSYGLTIQGNEAYTVRSGTPVSPHTILSTFSTLVAAMTLPNGVLPPIIAGTPKQEEPPLPSNIAPVVAQTLPESKPEHLRYFYIHPSLARVGRQMGGEWQGCTSVVSIIRATMGVDSPTVLLTFERGMGVREIAEAVHTLRLSLGRKAHVVVIEKGVSLRHQNELLLLRLGASLIIHADVLEERVPLLLESLRGQAFTRDIDTDFEASLANVVVSRRKGYLAPLVFSEEATGVVDRAESLNLPCAMAIGKPSGNRSCAELLAKLRDGRAGDLTTTDGIRCFLFFGDCPEDRLKQALQTTLGANVDQLFSSYQLIVDGPEIQKRLTALQRDTVGKRFPKTRLELVPGQAVTDQPAQELIAKIASAPLTQPAPVEQTAALPSMMVVAPEPEPEPILIPIPIPIPIPIAEAVAVPVPELEVVPVPEALKSPAEEPAEPPQSNEPMPPSAPLNSATSQGKRPLRRAVRLVVVPKTPRNDDDDTDIVQNG